MKPFHFPLENVLEYRRVQETAARQELALAVEKQVEASSRSREAAHALDALLTQIAAACGDRFSAADRERHWAVKQAQERLCAERQVALQECARRADEKRTLALAARRNRELLEHLRDARLGEWKRGDALAEQHLLDEIAMTRRHRTASKAEAVLC